MSILLFNKRSRGFTYARLLVILVLLISAAVFYFATGKSKLAIVDDELASAGASLAAVRESSAEPSNGKTASVAVLLAGLEARLAENPDNGKGWLLLAKSYDHLGDTASAVSAYSKATALGFSDAGLDGLTAGEPMQTQPGAVIRGRVIVAADAADLYEPTDTVFIVAKPVGDGPGIPLAVIRRKASELPFEFELSDRESMVAGSSLSEVSQIIVVAKISATGDAMSTRSGLEVSSQIISPQDANYLTLQLGVAAKSNTN